jgi:uncharacterized protein (DUF1697 family)
MTKFVAFLRAINVGGHVVPMAELRSHFEALGFKDVETFIASGNVAFASNSKAPAVLERKIEAHLQKVLGYEVNTFIRTTAEVAAIAEYKPFAPLPLQLALTFVVGFLAEPLNATATKFLMALKTEIDDFHVNGRELYWISRNRQSDSTFSNVFLEKSLKVRVTFRGMNTVRKLAAKYAGPA